MTSHALAMITPDPAADEERRRGLRRMRTLAVVAAAPRRGRLRRSPSASDGFLGLRQRRRRGVHGRRDRRLVRGDGAVQAPAGAADPAHRADPEAQGRARQGLEEFVGENFLQEEIIRERIGCRDDLAAGRPWLAEPANARRVVDEVADVAAIGARQGHATSTSRTWSARRWCRGSARSRSRRCSAACSPRRVRDDLHHGLVDLALDELHGWLERQPRDGRRGPGGAGAVVGADAAQRRASPRGCTSSWCAGSPTSGPTRATTPARRSTRCSPSSPRTCSRPRHPGARRAAQGAAARPPAGARLRASRCGTRCAARCSAR